MTSTVLERLLILLDGDARNYERVMRGAESTTDRSTRRMRGDIDGIGGSLRNLGSSLPALVGTGGLTYGLFNAAQMTVKAEAATRVYERAVARNNVSQSEAADITGRLAQRFGVLETDVQSAASILLRANLPLETIESTLLSAGASAAQTGFDISTAFQNVAVGVAMGRSEVVETSGIIANASEAWKTYADSVGKTVEELTQQEKALAYANAIIEESKYEVEDLDAVLGGLPSSQAAVNAEWRALQQTVGGAVRDTLLPLNEVLRQGLAWLNDLPAPVKQAGAAFVIGGTGAAALATGLGTVLTVLGPLAGPTGLFIAAAAGLSALAVAARSSLGDAANMQDAFSRAARKIGSANDRESLLSAAQDLESTLTGSARDAVSDYIKEIEDGKTPVDELKTSFDELKETLSAGSWTDLVSFERIMDQITGQPVSERLERNKKDLDFWTDFLTKKQGELERLQNTKPAEPILGMTFGMNAESIDLLTSNAETAIARARGNLAILERERDELMGVVPTVGPGGVQPTATFTPPVVEGSGGGGAATTEPTVQEIFDEVGAAGALAQQRAQAFGNTLDARLEAAESRASLLSEALDRVLARDDAPPGAVENLVTRLQDAQQEVLTLNGLLDGTAAQNAVLGRLESDAETYTEAPDSSALNARRSVFTEGAARQVETARQRADAEAIAADTATAQSAAMRERAADVASDLGSVLTSAGSEIRNFAQGTGDAFFGLLGRVEDVDARSQRISNEGRGGMRQSYIDANDPLFVGEGGYRDELQSFSGTNAELDAIRSNIQESLQAGEITLDQYRELLAIYRELASSGPIDLVGSANGPQGFATAGTPVNILGPNYDPQTGEQTSGPVVPTVEVDADPFAAAGADFLSSMEGIFSGFAADLGAALASGDFSELDPGAVVGGLAGAGATIGLNAIAPGLGTVLGPFVGSFIGGLFGGGDEEDADSRSRAQKDMERRGGGASVNISANVFQTNNYQGGPANAQNQIAFEKQTRTIVRAMFKEANIDKYLAPTGGAKA